MNLIIKTKIILIKSCKKIYSSIIGELASCKPNLPQFFFFEEIIVNVSLNLPSILTPFRGV